MSDPQDLRRLDLTPCPDACTTADFDEALDIVGRHGTGLLFLHGPFLRLVSGYECRWNGKAFVPHVHGRNLVSGRRPMPYCHHGILPHLLVPQDHGRVEFTAFLGTWGDRFDWGDGLEAGYPQYPLVRDCGRRQDGRWCDGKALEVTAVDAAGQDHAFSRIQWRFHHQPGVVRFTPESPHPVFKRVTLRVLADSFTFEVVVHLIDAHAAVGLEARPLLATLTRPPKTWKTQVDFLDPPFGWGRFRFHDLEAAVDPRGGLRFEASSAGLVLVVLAEGREGEARIAPVDPESSDRATLVAAGDWKCPCFDAALRVQPDGGRVVRFRLGAESLDTASKIHLPSSGRGSPLRLRSGDRHVDGYVRWARVTMRSLLWPNSALATGGLGYGGMSHVGQDIPFVYPFLLMEDHPAFRRAAQKNVAWVWQKAGTGAGITDHPSDGLDFAFLPQDPSAARVWKPTGAAGLCRQIQMLHRYWIWTGDNDRVMPWYARARDAYLNHYAPFSPEAPHWTTGLETQAMHFALVEAPAALAALADLADAFGTGGDRQRFLQERDSILALLDHPWSDHGRRLTEPLKSPDGQTLPPGLLVAPDQGTRTGDAFSFDVLLVNALALLRGAFLPERRADAVRHLADGTSPWWVEGRGLAKAFGGRLGVWYWHNALAVGALLKCRDLDAGYVDTAWKLMQWMGRGVVDMGGLGCPGEEIQGGNHAMAVGCLGPPLLLEGLLGMNAKPDGLSFSPVLPRGVDEVRLENLFFCDRLHHVHVRRDAGGICTEVARSRRPDLDPGPKRG